MGAHRVNLAEDKTGFTPLPGSHSDVTSEWKEWRINAKRPDGSRECKPRTTSLRGKPVVTGFTIIESVVAMAVFAVVLSLITGSFLAVLRISEKSRAVRTVEQNARFISEFLAREIRNGRINYGPSGYNGTVPNTGKVTSLYLNTASGEQARIFLSGQALFLTKSAGTTNLSSNDVTLTNLLFYVRPLTQGQPETVTFTYTITSNISGRLGGEASIVVQSTAAARGYD